MAHCLRLRMRTTAAALAGAVGLTLVVGSWLAGPGRAATPDPTPPPRGTVTMNATTTTAVPPSTPYGSWDSGFTTTSSPPPSSSTCYHYVPPTPGPGGVMQELGFEDGTVAGVYGTGGVTVSNTTEAAASGTHSLRADGITTTAAAVFPSPRVASYAWHRVTAKVRIPAGRPAAVVTLRPAGGSSATSMPGSVRATADGWTEITAYLKPTTMYMDWYCNGSMTGAQAPSIASPQLALDIAPCGGADRPTSVLVDDVVVAIDGVAPGDNVTPNGTATSGAVPASPPPPGCGGTTTTTPPPPPAPCLSGYQVRSTWPGGQLAEVTVQNLRPVTFTSWTVRWTFPDDRRITSLWGGSYTQQGRVVTVTSYPWQTLPQNGAVTIGMVLSGSGTGAPTGIAMDGNACPAAPR
jgi:Cellulose binding domain